jgi:hypothetical protein
LDFEVGWKGLCLGDFFPEDSSMLWGRVPTLCEQHRDYFDAQISAAALLLLLLLLCLCIVRTELPLPQCASQAAGGPVLMGNAYGVGY